MTQRNFKAGAGRSNPLVKLRGLKGSTYGAAGPVVHVDPASVTTAAPVSKIARAYAIYAKLERRAGRKPLMPNQWSDQGRRRTT